MEAEWGKERRRNVILSCKLTATGLIYKQPERAVCRGKAACLCNPQKYGDDVTAFPSFLMKKVTQREN